MEIDFKVKRWTVGQTLIEEIGWIYIDYASDQDKAMIYLLDTWLEYWIRKNQNPTRPNKGN